MCIPPSTESLTRPHDGYRTDSLYIYCPPPFAKAGDIKTHLSVHLSVPLSVTKTLTWLISSEVLTIEHWYLACMILVTSPFNWYHAVTLTFDLLQGQSCCRARDHNSLNLLVVFQLAVCIPTSTEPLTGPRYGYRIDSLYIYCISVGFVHSYINWTPYWAPLWIQDW